tara:strand:- start:807 stop:1820 length:1014 start_codon:yes stop_codon:yes gene_type:complete
MKKILAIIGLGPMGRRHLEAAKSLNKFKIIICDLNKNTTDQYNLKTYNNWKKLIKNEQIDILIIATNADSHYDIASFAIKKKIKRILCEKPLTTSILQGEKLKKLIIKNKTLFAVNHIRRWSDSYKKIKQLINENRFGKIVQIYFDMGGGQLTSNGGHLFDLARYLTNSEPKKIFAKIDDKKTPHPRGKKFTDPGGYGILLMKNKSRILFDMSEDYGTPTIIKILCEYGYILIDEKNKYWRCFARTKKDKKLPLTKRPNLVQIPFKGHGMIDMIKSSKLSIKNLIVAKTNFMIKCGIDDGIKSIEIPIGANISSKKNSYVYFPIKNLKIKKKIFKFT